MPCIKHASTALIVALGVAFFASGCAKREETASKKDAVPTAVALSELEQHGFFRVQWDVDIEDGDISSWPAGLYAKANSEVRKMVSQMFPKDDYRNLEVHIVPHFQGYTTLVLSRRKLAQEEQDQIRAAALAAIDEAHEKWVSSESKRAEPAATTQRP